MMDEQKPNKYAAQKRYRQKTYSTLTVDIRKELLEKFKATCAAAGVSQASVVTTAVQDFVDKHPAS